MTIELREGDWRDVLADVEMVDTLITDGPYGARTHNGQRHGRRNDDRNNGAQKGLLSSRGISYSSWTAEDVHEFVRSWAPRTRGWMSCLTSHDLIPAYIEAYKASGRYAFAPISCVQLYMNVRLAGDGPSNWSTYLMVSRPRCKPWSRWGALRGAYLGKSFDANQNALDRSKRIVAGGKPLWLMSQIITDYSRPGDLICDPCAGGATTLIAAHRLGRNSIGAELDPDTFAKAQRRIDDATAQHLLFT